MTPDPITQAATMVEDMELIESFLKRKGGYFGDMVHISIADLATALRQHQQDGGWLPIESAPRDGRWILGTRGRADDGLPYLPVVMFWNQGAWVIDSRTKYEPTLWHEIIDPPAPKKENDDA